MKYYAEFLVMPSKLSKQSFGANLTHSVLGMIRRSRSPGWRSWRLIFGSSLQVHGQFQRQPEMASGLPSQKAEGFDADHAEQNFAEKAVNIGEGDSLTSAGRHDPVLGMSPNRSHGCT
jgi:hypothetical protein